MKKFLGCRDADRCRPNYYNQFRSMDSYFYNSENFSDYFDVGGRKLHAGKGV
jgi:hypothetical protein